MTEPVGLNGEFRAEPGEPTVIDLAPDMVNPGPRIPTNAGISVPIINFVIEVLDLGLSKFVENQYRGAIGALLSDINRELPNVGPGFLVRANRYSYQGVTHIPGGVLLTPVGVGTEPIDALATSMWREEVIRPLPLEGAEDRSTYLWFTRQTDGKLRMYREVLGAADGFDARARKEFLRRKLQGYDRQDVFNRLGTIDTTSAWIQQSENLANVTEDQVAKSELIRFANNMRVAQARFDKAYAAYLSTQAAARSSGRLLYALQAASTIANLASSVSALGEIGANISRDQVIDDRLSELGYLFQSQSEIISEAWLDLRRALSEVRTLQVELSGVLVKYGADALPPLQPELPATPPQQIQIGPGLP